MSKQTEALKLALEAMQRIQDADMDCDFLNVSQADQLDEAITALREALAEQPAQQEPVAVVSGYYGGQCVILPINPARIFNSNTALYTSPTAQRKPLTDEQIVAKALHLSGLGTSPDVIQFARAIEAAHGITKGNT